MNIEYGTDRAVVTLVSEITDEVVIDLAATMRHLRHDCFYDAARLEIASIGGTETALSYWLSVTDRLREDGLRIETCALTFAGSAAAVVLSLGDHREAMPRARLHYHGVRIAERVLTAPEAAREAELMDRIDEAMLVRLADRALRADVVGASTFEMAMEDLPIAERLANDADWPGRKTRGEDADESPLDRLRQLVAWCAEGPRSRFVDLYGHLLRFDRTISPGLALELALIDEVAGRGRGDGEARHGTERRGKSPNAISVPEWAGLFPSGRMPREALCRHVLVLGEPGSGKSASAILPLVGALCDPANRVGCALLIDPKREIGQVISDRAGGDLRLIEPNGGGGVRQVLDVMASPEWSLDADLAAGRFKTAARKILLRSASLAPGSPAATLDGALARARDPYWENEGAKMALTVVATTLALMRAGNGPSSNDGRGAAAKDPLKRELRHLRLRAGIADAGADECREHPNVLALANRVHAGFFMPGNAPDELPPRPNRGGMRLAAKLADSFAKAAGELREVADDIRQWRQLAQTTGGGHYMGIHTMARQAFSDFGDGAAALSLNFGCEPGVKAAIARGDLAAVDFASCVDATEGRAIWLYQPKLSGKGETLTAKALKAAYFEAILSSRRRTRAGHDLPLAAYVADEAHRFVTCDIAHGEQSFMDACRSFGACCVLATQSASSLRHALGTSAIDGTGEHAVRMLLANTGTKLLFRSTDGPSQEYVRDCCPLTPGRPSVVDVRPLSSLRPGECYAVLADGRLERRRLVPYSAAEPRREMSIGG